MRTTLAHALRKLARTSAPTAAPAVVEQCEAAQEKVASLDDARKARLQVRTARGERRDATDELPPVRSLQPVPA